MCSCTLTDYYDDANNCLREFVEHSAKLYGKSFIIYNVHVLIHLVDVRKFGSLDNFSAFDFESFLGKLKRNIKSGNKPLEQICRRLTEQDLVLPTKISNLPYEEGIEHNLGPILPNFRGRQLKSVVVPNKYAMSIHLHSPQDSYCLTKDKSVVQIQNLLVENNELYILGLKFVEKMDFFKYPFRSSNIDMYLLKKLGTEYCKIPLVHIVSKCILLPFRDNYFVSIPILH